MKKDKDNMVQTAKIADDTRMNLASADIVGDRMETLKTLFPEAFSEGKVDFDKLRQALGDFTHTGPERYGLSWAGKSDAIRALQIPSHGTLVPVREESVNFDDSENLVIEGDNLEVLKLLQKSYHGKIKMIYIDPPYNTGNDFVYPDNFAEGLETYLKYTGQKDAEGFKTSTNTESGGRYHSNWLNMMYPRLFLARNLLQEDGVIFISIDENEQTNLKCVCDQIFGEENFVECITWNKRVPKNDKGIGNIHEYILIYVKDSQLKPTFTMRKDGLEDIYDLVDKLKRSSVPLPEAEQEIKKLYKKNGYDRGITLYNSFDKNYRLWGKINMSWPNADTFGPKYEVLHPKTNAPVKIPNRGWRWKKETFDEAAGIINGKYSNIKELHDGSYMCGRIWFAKDENTQPSSVNYLDDMNTFLLRSILSYKSDGSVEVEGLFDGKNYFSYPKPTSLLRALLGSQDSKDGDIYLDFFAGSGTTAHALMQLNSEDGKKRRMISVQLPENIDEKSAAFSAGYKTVSSLSMERIRRAAKKIKEENPLFSGDLGFKVFKLSNSNFKLWNPDTAPKDPDGLAKQLELYAENILPDRGQEDILYEIILKAGQPLTEKVEKRDMAGQTVFSIAGGLLLICLEDPIAEATLQAMIAAAPEQIVCLDQAFHGNDQLKTNIKLQMESIGKKFSTV